MQNVDQTVTSGFGQEWSAFTQAELDSSERERLFEEYFRLFPWSELPPNAVGLDAGCGSGRWALEVAPRVGHLHVLDASMKALGVAMHNLSSNRNVSFHHNSVSEIHLPDGSLDFAYSLGVLHHVPDTLGAVKHIASKLKPGAPFLIYLYYALDNRPWWFSAIWRLSNFGRAIISRLSQPLKITVSTVIAITIYWPLARLCTFLDGLEISTSSIPLAAYKDRSFYTMRTDAYDRFCTSLEKRFTRTEIHNMLVDAGFDRITFSEEVPFWCAIGFKEP